MGKLKVPEGKLLLPFMTGDADAAVVYEVLRSIRLYDPEPAAMRTMIPLDGAILESEGSNAASIFSRLQSQQPGLCARLKDFLAAVVDELVSISVRSAGGAAENGVAPQDEKWLRFTFDCGTGIESFSQTEVSDGTLRAMAILLAAMQRQNDGRPLPVVCIEEPEIGLHPAGSAAMMEGLREASMMTQILLTTHSPDMLDCLEREDVLLVVKSGREGTQIGPPTEVNRSIIRDHLYSPGELLRMDHLEPAITAEQPSSSAAKG
jgi:predicted ATPase